MREEGYNRASSVPRAASLFPLSLRAVVTDLPFRRVLGLNEQSYQRLRVALSLSLRRQVFIAVCDDLSLRDRLATRLLQELASHYPPAETYPRLVSLTVDFNDPNPITQITRWLAQAPMPRGGRRPIMPAFQFLGIEHLTRQPAVVQRLFFSHLQSIDRSLAQLESALLFWMPRPWFQSLPQSAPEFWRCRTAVFEFIGDPTPARTTESAPRAAVRQPDLSSQLPSAPLQRRANAAEEVAVPPSFTSDNGWLPLDPSLPTEDPTSPGDEAESSPPEAVSQPGELPEAVPQEFVADGTLFKKRLKKRRSHVIAVNGAAHPDNGHPAADPFPATEDAGGAIATVLAVTKPPTPNLPTLPEEVDTLPQEEGVFFQSLPFTEEAVPSSEQQQVDALLHQIELLQQQQAPATVLAEAYRKLGNIYRDRVEQGDLSPYSLEIAIQSYEQVLVWLPERSSFWADVLNDLGNLYWMQSRRTTDSTDAQDQLQRSIQAYQSALAKLDLALQADAYPMIQNNLGAAYADLSRFQNPAENLQRSIEAYHEALQHRTAEQDPLRYASTQNNLGTTYWNLAQYERPKEYIKQAIAAYSEALQYYRPDRDALNYAMIQNNLGTAYWNLSQHEQPQDWLRLAIHAYHIALRYRTLETVPAAYAATQNNLGTAYWHMAIQTKDDAEKRADCLRQSIQSYTAAITAAHQLAEQPYAMPLNFDLFATCNNLGLAQYQLSTDAKLLLDGDERTTLLEAALHNHVQALQGWQHKPEFRQTAFSGIVQAIRAIYAQSGLTGQNRALSLVPAALLPQLLPQLG